MVQYLIQERMMDPSAFVSKAMRYSQTNALHVASQYGYDLIVEYLMDKRKMDPSCLDENGNTPLQLAVIHNQFQVVDFLNSLT